MKIVNLILTYLVAAVFVVLGVGNYFFHFIPTPPPTPGLAGDFGKALYESGYMTAVKMFELAGGLMLAFNFKRALGWAILLPIVINIFFFEIFLAKAPGIGVALLIINLYMILFVYRDKFKSLWS